MTKMEAIAQVDALLPNTCSREAKALWVERVEQLAERELLGNRQGGYAPLPGQLRIPAPYDECYLRYLEAQIHYIHGEMTRYANAMMLFNSAYAGFCAWHIRNFLPRSPEGREGKPCVIPPI